MERGPDFSSDRDIPSDGGVCVAQQRQPMATVNDFRTASVDASSEPGESREELETVLRAGLRYFVENQTAEGLFLDRQRNHGEPYNNHEVPCSISASGMGMIALPLAIKYGLLSREEAIDRCRLCMETALNRLPEDHGLFPHFVQGSALKAWGEDAISTIDSSWLIAGAGCSAEQLQDARLQSLASQLYERVNWRYWQASDDPSAGISHGKDGQGNFLYSHWDTLSSESAFMYVLAAGADENKCIFPDAWNALDPAIDELEGIRFGSAKLGMYLHQCGEVLLDSALYQNPGPHDLLEHQRSAALAHVLLARKFARQYRTFMELWGVSAGDAPGSGASRSMYEINTPHKHDGTVHVTASIAFCAHRTADVLRNIRNALKLETVWGRYGFSNVNLDAGWRSDDMVGFDAGVTALATANLLDDHAVHKAFHAQPHVQRGLARLGFRKRDEADRKGCRITL